MRKNAAISLLVACFCLFPGCTKRDKVQVVQDDIVHDSEQTGEMQENTETVEAIEENVVTQVEPAVLEKTGFSEEQGLYVCRRIEGCVIENRILCQYSQAFKDGICIDTIKYGEDASSDLLEESPYNCEKNGDLPKQLKEDYTCYFGYMTCKKGMCLCGDHIIYHDMQCIDNTPACNNRKVKTGLPGFNCDKRGLYVIRAGDVTSVKSIAV